MKRFLLLSLALGISACSSAPLALPSKVGQFESKIEVPSKARVMVLGKSSKCESIRQSAKFELVSQTGVVIPMRVRCEKQNLVGQSDFQPVGIYRVKLSMLGNSLKELSPVITLELANPDYHSGADQYSEGATAFESGKPAEGTVNYVAGDTTDWLRLSGEKKRVYLTFSPPDESTIEAAVYRKTLGGKPVRIAALKAGRPSSYYLGKEDLLVRVTANSQENQSAYTLLRRDEEARKAVSLRVVDAYPVSTDSSLVLLTPNPQVKADDEIQISAKTEVGSWKDLGPCRVTHTSGESIQCELNGAWSERFLEYRATGSAPVSG